MESVTLEQIIRTHVKLGKPNTKGWESCLHLGCDSGKKGDRAAFLFEGTTVAFNCFNCGAKTVYSPDSHKNIPKTMQTVLDAFGIPQTEYQKAVLTALSMRDTVEVQKQQAVARKMEPASIPLLDSFYLLDNASEDDQWAITAKQYLKTQRMIDPASYPFILSSKPDDMRDVKWMKRLIIPIFKDGNVIFYQGRDLTGNAVKKYESPSVSKDRVLYGFDQLYADRDKPLYIVEGVFDAMLLNGVAVLGNTLSITQIQWLNKSPRRKVYIPDRFGDGRLGVVAAYQQGWQVSIPWERSWNDDLKDITDMIAHYGKLFVYSQLVDNTMTPRQTKMLYNTKVSENQHVNWSLY